MCAAERVDKSRNLKTEPLKIRVQDLFYKDNGVKKARKCRKGREFCTRAPLEKSRGA